jgi:hypothetical protein
MEIGYDIRLSRNSTTDRVATGDCVRILQRVKALGETRRRERPRWPLLAKAATTLVLLTLLVWQIDIAATLRALRESDRLWLLLAVASTALMVLTSVRKWACLVRDLRLPVSTTALARFYLVGVFASSFLPGIVGGDVVRWQLTARRTARSVESAATILADRAIGVAAMVTCALVAMAIEPRLATLPVLVLVLGTVAALVGVTGLAVYRPLAVGAAWHTRRSPLRRILRPLYRLHREFRRFSRPALLGSFGCALLFYLSASLTFWLVLRSLGTGLGFGEAFATQVVTNLLTLLPISVGGLGLVQAGDVYLLGLFGVGPAVSFAASIVRQLLHYLWAVVGGVLLWGRDRGLRPGRETFDPL